MHCGNNVTSRSCCFGVMPYPSSKLLSQIDPIFRCGLLGGALPFFFFLLGLALSALARWSVQGVQVALQTYVSRTVSVCVCVCVCVCLCVGVVFDTCLYLLVIRALERRHRGKSHWVKNERCWVLSPVPAPQKWLQCGRMSTA